MTSVNRQEQENTKNVVDGSQGDRKLQLDGIRAFAALFVIYSHTMPINNGFVHGGHAVLLFFILSGFLITGILLKQRDSSDGRIWPSLRIFYGRRLLRIFPLYYLVLFLAVGFNEPEVRHYFPWYFFFLTNVLISSLGYPVGLTHYWSLAIEEQFYLVWPALIFLVPRRSIPWVLVLAVMMSPVYLPVALYFGKNLLAPWDTFSNISYLAMGALLAVLHYHGELALADRLVRGSLIIGIALLLLQWTLDRSGRMVSLRMTANDFGVGLLALGLVHRGAIGFKGIVGRFLSWSPLVYLGTISYGLYVYHGFLPARLGLNYLPIGPLKFASYMAVTLPVAVLSWHFFEKPINDLKRFLPYSAVEPTLILAAEPLDLPVAAVRCLDDTRKCE